MAREVCRSGRKWRIPHFSIIITTTIKTSVISHEEETIQTKYPARRGFGSKSGQKILLSGPKKEGGLPDD